jgi:hypothetical protein
MESSACTQFMRPIWVCLDDLPDLLDQVEVTPIKAPT